MALRPPSDDQPFGMLKSLLQVYLIVILLFLPISSAVRVPSSTSGCISGVSHIVSLAASVVLPPALDTIFNDGIGRPPGVPNVRRERKHVKTIFCELGPAFTRRSYRMHEPSFWKLLRLLEPHMNSHHGRKRKRGATPNGDITSSARLSMAIRYFAGGDPLDIMTNHGVAHGEVYNSVWEVVDAVNLCPELQMQFPDTYEDQREIAKGFEDKSWVNFDNCVGAIDGMLVWTNKPSKVTLKRAGLGPKKFFCGRKKKYGLNLQAVCDHNRKFLDVEVSHPAATSDYLCFATSAICQKLETPGFLAPGLCLYGDNAYVNTPYMASPFKNVSSGPKDAYNFFHSSLRINIECAFGMLVHRWGVLRKPIPMNVSIEKTTSLVRCLCCLHNFCIDETQLSTPRPMAKDVASIASEGGMLFEKYDNSDERIFNESTDRITDYLDGGDHFDDVPRTDRRIYERINELPRDRMLAHIIQLGHTQRPKPKRSN